MAHYWILIFSWFSCSSIGNSQYINTAGPGADAVIDALDATIHYPPLPYVNYLNLPPIRNNYETFQNDEQNEHNPFYLQDNEQREVQRKRRTAQEIVNDIKEKPWLPNLIDKDKTIYLQNDERTGPFIVGFASTTDDNLTDILNAVEKRNFSPWGGKRGNVVEHYWTWKRSAAKEPSMPKRVRFSPWGGKRSGQVIFKPGTKGSKIIFSASVPELTRIVSKYPPGEQGLNLAGLHVIPSLDKRHPIKVLALGAQMDERNLKDALPFRPFLDSLPKTFKPGHTYSSVNLKKDGKRKVKFSVWGGKRAPPIIGPIWTPASENFKESALDTVLLIRNNESVEDLPKSV